MNISPSLIAAKIPHIDGKKLRSCFINVLVIIIEQKNLFAQKPIAFLEIIFAYIIEAGQEGYHNNNQREKNDLFVFFSEIKRFLCKQYIMDKNTSLLIFNTTSIIEMLLHHYHSYGATVFVDNNDHGLYLDKIYELLELYKFHPYYLFIHTKKELIKGFQIYCKHMRLESSVNRIILDAKKELGVEADEL